MIHVKRLPFLYFAFFLDLTLYLYLCVYGNIRIICNFICILTPTTLKWKKDCGCVCLRLRLFSSFFFILLLILKYSICSLRVSFLLWSTVFNLLFDDEVDFKNWLQQWKLSSSRLNRSSRCPNHQAAYSGNPLCNARYLRIVLKKN